MRWVLQLGLDRENYIRKKEKLDLDFKDLCCEVWLISTVIYYILYEEEKPHGKCPIKFYFLTSHAMPARELLTRSKFRIKYTSTHWLRKYSKL